MPSTVSLAGGFALGLASSLHCIGMCGGIAVLFGHGSSCGGAMTASRSQALLHAGRITSYAALGGLAGGMGSAAFGHLDPGVGHQLLRWAAALSLGWMGLAMIGLMPAPAFIGHAGPGRQAMRLMLRLPMPARRIAGGLAWGLLPCGMVYGALFFAMFAGTAAGGMLVMLGFGLGTLPALIVAGLGFGQLQAVLRKHAAEKWLGAAVTVIALSSLIDSPATLGNLCGHLARSFGI